MIVGSFGQIAAISARDHETGRRMGSLWILTSLIRGAAIYDDVIDAVEQYEGGHPAQREPISVS